MNRITTRALILALVLVPALPVLAGRKRLKDIQAEFTKAVKSNNGPKIKEAVQELVDTGDSKAVEFLIDEGLVIEDAGFRTHVVVALGSLTERRAVKTIAKAFDSAKDIPKRRALATVLERINEKEAHKALEKGLREKHPAARVAAARALGNHAMGKSSESRLRKLLKDDALRVRKAAADALNRLGVPIKGYEVDWGRNGLPDKFFASDVAFLFDNSEKMNERRFIRDEAPKAAKADDKAEGKDGQKPEDGKPAATKLLTGAELQALAIRGALDRLTEEQRLLLGGYNLRTVMFGKGLEKVRERTIEDAKAWLDKGFRALEERDLLRAVKAAAIEDVDEIYLFIGGQPFGGIIENRNEIVQRIVELVTKQGIILNTIAVDAPPAEAPNSNFRRQQQDSKTAALRDLAEELARRCGGRTTLWRLSKPPEPEKGDKPKDAAGAYTPPEPEKGKLDYSARKKALKDLKEALKSPKKPRSLEVIEELAALPEDKIADELLDEAVFSDSMEVSEAAIRGLAKNTHPDVVETIAKELKSEREGGRQVLLVRCFAPCPATTAELTPLLYKLERDALRVALTGLMARPRKELEPEMKRVLRKLKKATGKSRVLLDRYEGKVIPAGGIAKGACLPRSFESDAVGFIIDVHRGTRTLIKEPPKAAQKKDKKGKSGKKDKKDKKAKDGKKAKTVSHFEVMMTELEASLAALGKGGRKGYVVAMGDTPTRAASRDPVVYDAPEIAKAKKFLERQQGNVRDVAAAILKGLKDPTVEELYVLVYGMPIRAELGRTDKIVLAIDELNRKRRVPIHVTVFNGIPEFKRLTEAEEARRIDEELALKTLYEAIADRSGGTWRHIEKLPGSAKPSSAKPPSGKK